MKFLHTSGEFSQPSFLILEVRENAQGKEMEKVSRFLLEQVIWKESSRNPQGMFLLHPF